MSRIEEAINVIIQELNLQTEEDVTFCRKVSDKLQENFSGYNVDFEKMFANKIPNTKLSSPIEFAKIPFISYCKHHMSPIVGKVTVCYTPNQCIVGLSRIVECVNSFARRLQLQEEMTVQITECINKYLSPKSVSVEISAKHYCMQRSANDSLPTIKTSHEIVA